MSDEWIVTMPKLGETVTEGTVGGWRKQVGDSVEFDDPLFEVSTDKIDTEIPSPYDGVILEILVPEGETVPVGTPLVRIGTPGSTPDGENSAVDSDAVVRDGTSPAVTSIPTSADNAEASTEPDGKVHLTIALPREERQRLGRLANAWMKTNKTTALVRALRLAEYLYREQRQKHSRL